MGNLTRPDLARLPTFRGSRHVPGAVNLTTNEMPYGPPPAVVAAIAEAAEAVRLYPDLQAIPLRTTLAERYDVSADRIVTGCGSMALLEHLVTATCLPGDQILCAWPSFEPYPVIAAAAGATCTMVRNTPEHSHDLTTMARAVSERTRLVIICSPNNPTGVAVRRAELDTFLDAVPPDVLVAMDEAYHEFVTDPDVADGVADCRDRPNVAVLRTFSKAWGIAGLRVGYLVAPAKVAAAVRSVTTLWSTSAVGQAAALAALGAEGEIRDRVERVTEERERVLTAVRAVIPDVPDSQGNFVWLPLGEQRTQDLVQACERRNVLVRGFFTYGVRVTIGTPEENDAFLDAFSDTFVAASVGGAPAPALP